MMGGWGGNWNVAPVRERGLKCRKRPIVLHCSEVAPVRERGLKSVWFPAAYRPVGRRSREGAWIEIHLINTNFEANDCRSREGAWIEMAKTTKER
mgnify:CR=1 FL=1